MKIQALLLSLIITTGAAVAQPSSTDERLTSLERRASGAASRDQLQAKKVALHEDWLKSHSEALRDANRRITALEKKIATLEAKLSNK